MKINTQNLFFLVNQEQEQEINNLALAIQCIMWVTLQTLQVKVTLINNLQMTS